MLPPDDCMTRSREAVAFPFGTTFGCPPKASSNRPRYDDISGPTYAFTATVLVRSYSRYWGSTRLDTERKGVGSSRESSSSKSTSCAGSRKEKRRDTATACAPDAATRSAIRRA